jgi:glycosyltransferase involved in cell wall biosynthesis
LKSTNLTHLGSYTQEELPGLLRDHPVDVMLLLSTWPETFSYTLSESIAAGVPPIVTNLGAQKERIEDSQIGWIVDYKSPEKIVALLRFILQHKEEIDHRRRRIKDYHLKSMREMKKDYKQIYFSFI